MGWCARREVHLGCGGRRRTCPSCRCASFLTGCVTRPSTPASSEASSCFASLWLVARALASNGEVAHGAERADRKLLEQLWTAFGRTRRGGTGTTGPVGGDVAKTLQSMGPACWRASGRSRTCRRCRASDGLHLSAAASRRSTVRWFPRSGPWSYAPRSRYCRSFAAQGSFQLGCSKIPRRITCLVTMTCSPRCHWPLSGLSIASTSVRIRSAWSRFRYGTIGVARISASALSLARWTHSNPRSISCSVSSFEIAVATGSLFSSSAWKFALGSPFGRGPVELGHPRLDNGLERFNPSCFLIFHWGILCVRWFMWRHRRAYAGTRVFVRVLSAHLV